MQTNGSPKCASAVTNCAYGLAPLAATTTYSATEANPDIPEMTKSAQQKHMEHLQAGKSYAGMTMQEYVAKSSELARSAVGGDIDGFVTDDGAVVRYNKATNDFVKAYATGVATMFKPGGKLEYFERERGK